MSLVQVLIAVGIMATLSSAFVSMTVHQNREIASLQAHLASADFQNVLSATFGKVGVCTQVTAGATFDSSNATLNSSNPPTINLTTSTLPSSTEVGAPPIATAGATVSPLSSLLTFQNMPATFQITDIRGSGNSFKGILTANYDSAKLPRWLAPAKVSVTLTTTNSGTTHTIASCLTDGPVTPTLSCQTVVGWVQANCPAGYTMMGGGCTTPTGGNIIANHTSMPSGNGWWCAYEMCWGSCTVQGNGYAYAQCCKLQ